jgi:(p)ppGpp synthase/HD superfamily hydrolase
MGFKMNLMCSDDNFIERAIEVAVKAHEKQVRKGTDIPYITHPLAVGIMLARADCADEVVAGGILHDTIEDTSITIDYIREKFGDKVASIVEGCSEPNKSLPWEDRKKHTIEFLKTAPFEVRLVACADKLHNIRTIAHNHRRIGDEIWERFKRGRKKQEWYYRNLVSSLCNRSDNRFYVSLFQQFKCEVEILFSMECGQ